MKKIKYEIFRTSFKDGDMLLSMGEGIFSSIIKWFSNLIKKRKKHYSHASIVAWWGSEKTPDTVADYGRLMVLEAVKKGVIATPISEIIKKYKGKIHWYKCPGLTDEERARIIETAKEHLGKEYTPWYGFLKFFSKPNRENRKGKRPYWFCSELAANAYTENGHDPVKKKSDGYTLPDDLAESPIFESMGEIN